MNLKEQKKTMNEAKFKNKVKNATKWVNNYRNSCKTGYSYYKYDFQHELFSPEAFGEGYYNYDYKSFADTFTDAGFLKIFSCSA